MTRVPDRWRFNFDDCEVSFRDLSWPEAEQIYRGATDGDLTGHANGEYAVLEFDCDHAAVLFMGRDGIIMRPFFTHRQADEQDLSPFFCSCCGIQIGDRAEYLARFVDRAAGFRLFVALLCGPGLPAELPDPLAGYPVLPGCDAAFAEAATGRALVWQPLPYQDLVV